MKIRIFACLVLAFIAFSEVSAKAVKEEDASHKEIQNENFRELSLYGFEYQLIPHLINVCEEELSTSEELVRYMSEPDWIFGTVLPQYRMRCNFDTLAVKVLSTDAGKNVAVIVYTFPAPDKSPLAKYGAIVVNSNGASYYTLERADEIRLFDDKSGDAWILGTTSSKKGHSNYGEVNDCATPEQFIAL
ncbi:MAG: hypothetical protein K2L99_04490, partial [Muribaculaceae bacterium]|nr:hypothetical protein [Muribaculaceae bacterium]